MTDRRTSQFQQAQVIVKARTASFAPAHTDIGLAFTNSGAAGAITASLPKASPGAFYWFFVATAQSFVVAPKAVDTIRGHALGVCISANTVGNFLWLQCLVTGFWEPLINVGPFA